MSTIVDLRSDTLTQPTPAMRKAMFEAEVGDDVQGEDPTVNRLESRAAEILGKQAAVYVPSGTMGNQAAIKAHTQPGQEIICEERAHIILYEMGMPAAFSGCLVRAVPTPEGMLRWQDITPRLRPASDHYRGTALIEVENTVNIAGGRVYPLEQLAEIGREAKAAGVKVHMDGARVFNAALASGCAVSDIAATVDSMCFCLSKGLGAPVGSIVVGDKDFIEEVRLVRKALGGGMRQAGVIAAAGLVALEESPKRLHEDHENAQYLAGEIRRTDGLRLDPDVVETNILFFTTLPGRIPGAELRLRLKQHGVLVSGAGDRIRMVTHQNVDRAGCVRAIEAIRAELAPAGESQERQAQPVGGSAY
ncbi:MAG: low specificity L-threonine aldolase [Acidobacteria bacterium]|nr:low specificity L-threonine aldolase [Acidobacteriota bacterium]